jgi:hypothetical protein
MIFRDKKTGTLLNIRRDEYMNDRMYFQEIIHVERSSGGGGDKPKSRPYSIPFQDLQSQNNYT